MYIVFQCVVANSFQNSHQGDSTSDHCEMVLNALYSLFPLSFCLSWETLEAAVTIKLDQRTDNKLLIRFHY